MAPAKFDLLVAIVFDSDFNVDYAATIPGDQVRRRCRHVRGRNTFAMPFPRKTLSLPGVRDITAELSVFPPTKEEKYTIAAIEAWKTKRDELLQKSMGRLA